MVRQLAYAFVDSEWAQVPSIKLLQRSSSGYVLCSQEYLVPNSEVPVGVLRVVPLLVLLLGMLECQPSGLPHLTPSLQSAGGLPAEGRRVSLVCPLEVGFAHPVFIGYPIKPLWVDPEGHLDGGVPVTGVLLRVVYILSKGVQFHPVVLTIVHVYPHESLEFLVLTSRLTVRLGIEGSA